MVENVSVCNGQYLYQREHAVPRDLVGVAQDHVHIVEVGESAETVTKESEAMFKHQCNLHVSADLIIINLLQILSPLAYTDDDLYTLCRPKSHVFVMSISGSIGCIHSEDQSACKWSQCMSPIISDVRDIRVRIFRFSLLCTLFMYKGIKTKTMGLG